MQACLERRHSFTRMVYSTGGIPVAKALASQRRLSALLSFKLKWEYSELCGFLRDMMPLAVVNSNILLLRDPQYKEARIHQIQELTNGAVMALLAPWYGYRVRLQAQQAGIWLEEESEYSRGGKGVGIQQGREKDYEKYRESIIWGRSVARNDIFIIKWIYSGPKWDILNYWGTLIFL